MSFTSSDCARAASCIRSTIVLSLLTATTMSFGQELKAASTLGFSVHVLGPSTAQFLSVQSTKPVDDEYSGSVSIPLGAEPSKSSAIEVIARFHGDTSNSSVLTARVDGGETQKLFRRQTTASSVLSVPRQHVAAGAPSRIRVLELNWKTVRAEEDSNVLEIEILQY
jgi:hypothetical protein